MLSTRGAYIVLEPARGFVASLGNLFASQKIVCSKKWQVVYNLFQDDGWCEMENMQGNECRSASRSFLEGFLLVGCWMPLEKSRESWMSSTSIFGWESLEGEFI